MKPVAPIRLLRTMLEPIHSRYMRVGEGARLEACRKGRAKTRLQPLRESPSGPEGPSLCTDVNGTAGSRAPSQPGRVNSRCALAAVLCFVLLASTLPAQQPSQTPYTLKARSEVVLVNVTARDKKGALVRDLTADDFTVTEDGKQQKVTSFDLENTDAAPETAAGPEQTTVLTLPKPRAEAKPAEVQPQQPSALKDRRLLILFFVLSAM